MEKVQLSNEKCHFIFSLLFLGWIVDSLTLFGMNIAIKPRKKIMFMENALPEIV